MSAFLGYGGILIALAGSIGLVVTGIRGPRDRIRIPVALLVAGALLAMGALELALLTDDFSIRYTAEHHARSTPLLYTIATAWAALEGSIVLWGLVLAAFTAAVFRRVGSQDRLGWGAMAVMGAVGVFFFGLMATIANPFQMVPVVPVDGPGPNPLLQNHVLMAIHPPMLYVGFVGFTVPFAFAFGALARGRHDDWLTRAAPWTRLAWTFLTLGIVLGAWWSYEVLGWGGYWAWDPVENASFIPWLVGTAFLHSSVMERRRGILRAWNVALALATFSLTILGTFLTRSGVVVSVHSFTQSAIGPAFLAFLLLVVGAGFGLLAARVHLVASPSRIDSLVSREGSFLANNLLLTVFAFTVLTGTLYPILVEAFSGAQVSVGRPFFDRLATPLSFALLLTMGIGPFLPYGLVRGAAAWRRMIVPMRISLGTGALLVLVGVRSPSPVLAVMLGVLVISAAVGALIDRAGRVPDTGTLASLGRVVRGDPGFWGGQLSHVGVALVAIAIALSGHLATRGTVTLEPGQSSTFAGYELRYGAPFSRQEPNRSVVGGRIEVLSGDRVRATLEPRFNDYGSAVQPVPTPAVLHSGWSDLYVTLRSLDSERATFELIHFPAIGLLWLGGLTAVAGGAYALVGRRRSLARV